MRNEATEHEAAEQLIERLAKINEASIVSRGLDRTCGRAALATEIREVFKCLGLKKISVRVPNYSMASTVDVRLPKLQIHCPDMFPHNHAACCGPNGTGHTPENRCPACRMNADAETKVEEILARAFPRHDDRSDSQSDYFDKKICVD